MNCYNVIYTTVSLLLFSLHATLECYLLIMVMIMFFIQSYCDDPDLVLELKNLIVIFADTLQVDLKLYVI